MNESPLVVGVFLVVTLACSDAEIGATAFDGGVPCEDCDHDRFGRNCASGYDCDDNDPTKSNQCRACATPELGCSCSASDGPLSCFQPDKTLSGGDVMCSEGTRSCRNGVWSSRESVHSYIVAAKPDTQRVVDPNAGQATCSICDLKCFRVVDDLLADGGSAGGNVGLPGDGGTGGMLVDAGGSGLTGCRR